MKLFGNSAWRTALGSVLAGALTLGLAACGADPSPGAAEEGGPKSLAEIAEGAETFEGLFTFYRNTKTGESYLLVQPDQLEQEFIYWKHVADGVPEADAFRGMYGDSAVIEFRKRFDRIEIVEKNTAFFFDDSNAVAKAAEANISDAVLAVMEIVGVDEKTGAVLVNADELFASQALVQVKPTPNPDADPKRDFALGELDENKTHILGFRSYPENVDVEVRYVFHNAAPYVAGGEEITDPRNVTTRMMHSFLSMPDDDFQPRLADPRIGHFMERVTDLTSTEVTPYRDLIHRWHLVKKDPDAEMSEPVEPITWWIENTTPVEWRELIRSAALEWNKPFEKIGFRNAVVVKVQPEDADWDAGDIRYNVLRWTSSPSAQFGGYGPHFANPRTGQILGADVMLEFGSFHRLPRLRRLIQDPVAVSGGQVWSSNHHCSVGEGLAMSSSFARAATAALYGEDDALQEQLLHDRMHFLILHEIGHTLGMNHNMGASQMLSLEEVFDREAVEGRGLTGSIMDYPAVNIAATREEQTRYYPVAPGPYDDWFIEYSYSTALEDEEGEAARLAGILSRSTQSDLIFGNDADDMRGVGTGIDPRVNIFDMSSDAVAYADDQIDLMRLTLNSLATKPPGAGESWEATLEGVSSTLNLWRAAASVVSRYVGGVYVDRAMVGQEGAGDPFNPVEAERQRQAMDVLARQVFAAGAFDMNAEVLRRAAPERRGFDHFSDTQDPKIHDAVLRIQRAALDHLLSPVVLQRISDTQLYGSGYPLEEMMQDLTGAVFSEVSSGQVSSFQQNLQVEYVERLASIVRPADGAGAYHAPAVSLAVYSLNGIRDRLGKGPTNDVATEAHQAYLRLLIDRALATAV